MSNYGKLEVITGPMFGQKTTELIKKFNQDDGDKIAVKPVLDNRYEIKGNIERYIISHDNVKIPAKVVYNNSSWKNLIKPKRNYYISEVQFFCSPYYSGSLISLVKKLLNKGSDVIVEGLNMDYKGNPFIITANLMAMADVIHMKTSRCHKEGCNIPATKTYKKIKNNKRIEIGSSEIYTASCNNHWSY